MNEKIVCPIMQTIAMVSDKWKVLILYQLRDGKKRFNELRRSMQGVTQRVLTHQLRALESDGLVSRTVYAEVPPKVEYELTTLGLTLIPVLDQFESWARQNSEHLINIRKNSKSKNKCHSEVYEEQESQEQVAQPTQAVQEEKQAEPAAMRETERSMAI